MAVGLQAGEEDVEEPQTQEERSGHQAGHPGTAELSANGRPSPEQKHPHAEESENGEEGDGESQRSRVHPELFPLDAPVDGGH